MMSENRNFNPKGKLFSLFAIIVLAVLISQNDSAKAQTDSEEIKAMRKTIEALMEKVEKLEARQESQSAETRQQKDAIKDINANISKIESSDFSIDPVFKNLHIGGYGEAHANFGEGKDADQFDLHRLVFYFGYDFADWIKFHSEFEVEHAYVDDGDGQFVVEQAYVDFLLSDGFNIRAGRVLTPLGIINKFHEPTLFNSVERPSFAKYIIPTTWSSDGIGIFGALSDELTYEAYVVGGLNGSKFDDVKGIRSGRIKERPDLSDPAFTGRIDYFPMINSNADESLRLGLSGYAGGVDNGDQGKSPGIDGDIRILSADMQYSISKFDLTGAVAHTKIDNAADFGDNTAEEIFGWYIEGGYHYWPESWKKGKFAKTDAIAFIRYDDFDTQYKMPSGSTANPAGDRNEITFGTAIKLTPNFVVKADYQIRDDKTGDDLGDRINFGIGYTF